MIRSIESSDRALPSWAKLVISVAVLVHLWAVVAPPLAFQTQGPLGRSPSVSTLAGPVQGYGEFLYLNRGYAFFAPDPGPSHLVQAAYVDASGNRVEEMFPDRERQWPRLLYHRHFMLSEFLHEIYFPPGPPEELQRIDPIEARNWAFSRARYENVRKSYTDHLSHNRPGSREMAIRRIEHRIPNVNEFLAEPLLPTDPRMYGVLVDRPLDFIEPGPESSVVPEVVPAAEAQRELIPESGAAPGAEQVTP